MKSSMAGPKIISGGDVLSVGRSLTRSSWRTDPEGNVSRILERRLFGKLLHHAFFPQLISFLSESVFQNNFVNDLSTNNTSPSEIIFGPTIELFIRHQAPATVAFHKDSTSFYPKIYSSNFKISRLGVIIKDRGKASAAHRVENNTYESVIVS